MKSVNANLKTALRSSHDIKALPRLTVEWNLNRYVGSTVTNVPSEDTDGNDIDMFPIESLVAPNRPSKGINKARINASLIADDYTSPAVPRFYVAGLEDKYKYWQSPYTSDSAGNISRCTPLVVYERDVVTNKIVIGIENSWATPTAWTIQVSTDRGVSWRVVSSAPTIGADGRAVLYWNGTSWSSTRPSTLDNHTTISGVRVVVNKLGAGRNSLNQTTTYRQKGVTKATNGGWTYCSLIEISARLEKDFSDRLESVSDTFDAGENSLVTPMGTITSNVGSLTLWNGDNILSDDNTGSIYRNLMEPNAKMNLEYVYYIGAQQYAVQQFNMFVEDWEENDDRTVSVSLSDGSKFLKEIHPQPAKYENVTLSQIVYRVCDSIGFTDYNVYTGNAAGDFRIPVFWVDGTKTVWEVFDDLAIATQSLIYFDSWGRLNVKPRDAGYNKSRAIDWTLRARKVGTDLPDIADLEQGSEYGSNLIKVKYKKTSWSDEINGHPVMTTAWSPDSTVTLRSTPLTGSLTKTSQYIQISPTESAHWPYEGHIQVEGEFIEYSGKKFKYRDGSAWKYAIVHNKKEYDECNEKTPSNARHQNSFVGHLMIKERGVWNTETEDHRPEAKGWVGKRFSRYSKSAWASNKHHSYQKSTSTLKVRTNGGFNDTAEMALVVRGTDNDTGWRHFGTKMRFNSGDHQRAGIVINHRGNGEGYYIQLRPTNTIKNKDRNKEDEVTVFSVKNGVMKQFKTGIGTQDVIATGIWYELDVYYNWDLQRLTVYLDGNKLFNADVPSNLRHTPGGRFGMYIAGSTNVDYEYFYAVAREPNVKLDEPDFYDRVRGGYVGDAWNTEWVYEKKSKRRWVKRKGKKKKIKKNVKYKKNLQFFDEFGPYVHEVREYDVKFDPAPVAHSRLFLTNDQHAVCPEYRADAFGAYFIVANKTRTNAVVHGDDDLTFAISGETVSQQMVVIGRALVIADQEEVVVRNEDQIRSRGEIVAEIDSDWIQSEEAAQAVANWIGEHWSKGTDELTVSVFGNPLFEIGDLVSIDYPNKNMAPATHQYFVTRINTEFNEGLTTSLTLQRKN